MRLQILLLLHWDNSFPQSYVMSMCNLKNHKNSLKKMQGLPPKRKAKQGRGRHWFHECSFLELRIREENKGSISSIYLQPAVWRLQTEYLKVRSSFCIQWWGSELLRSETSSKCVCFLPGRERGSEAVLFAHPGSWTWLVPVVRWAPGPAG